MTIAVRRAGIGESLHAIDQASDAVVEGARLGLAIDRPDQVQTNKRLALPVVVFALAVLAWFGFQTSQLLAERAQLNVAIAAQETQVKQAKKLRADLDALARDTAKLAAGGNANAQLLVDELRKRGVTINPNAPPPPQ